MLKIDKVYTSEICRPIKFQNLSKFHLLAKIYICCSSCDNSGTQ